MANILESFMPIENPNSNYRVFDNFEEAKSFC